MITAYTYILATVCLFCVSTFAGMFPVVKMIRVFEAKHELKHGSAGWLRSIAGWSVIGFWLMAVWYIATIIGDWGVSGDLSGAIGRSLTRLRVLLEIAAALAEADN